MSSAKSLHLRCYTPKIRPKNESSQVSQKNSYRVSLLFNFNCEYTRQRTIFIGRGALVVKMGKGRMVIREGRPRGLTMVKTAP